MYFSENQVFILFPVFLTIKTQKNSRRSVFLLLSIFLYENSINVAKNVYFGAYLAFFGR